MRRALIAFTGAGAAAVLAGGAVVLAGCGTPDSSATAQVPPAATQAAPAVVSWSAADQAQLAPGTSLALDIARGKLVSFDVKTPDGHPIATNGTASAPLPPSGQFTAAAVVARADGSDPQTQVRTVTTAPAAHQLTASISPADGAAVGVGEPIIVTLSSAAVDHAAVEKHLHVTTSRPVGPAGWYWFSDTRVEYRPEHYWPANTKITVKANLDGVRTGETTWGAKNTTSTFTTGRSQILKIDDATHMMTVVRDGQAIRTIPVSMGQHIGTWTTRSGIKTIMSIQRTVRMDSSTVGITGAGAYDEIVPYAMRLTWSGEYIHGAPWSEYAQGRYDVSHGCVNVSLANAEWLYSNSMIGDVVDTTGTGRPMETDGNGTGGVWNIPWAQWQQGSALH